MCLAVAALSLALAPPALAREVTEADRAEIAAVVGEFAEVVEIGDMPGLVGFIPPPMVTTIARANGMSEDALMEAMAFAMMQAMDGVSFESFEIDLAAAESGETPAGRPYLIAPTTSIMQVEGTGRVTATSTTLALEDEGRWYIARIDDASQLAVLRDTYPDFEGIDFPEGTMEFE